MSDREMSDEERLGAAHRGGHMDPTNGIQALHCQSPLEVMISLEEEDPARVEAEQRLEGMRRFLAYLFGDGKPEELCYSTRRLYSIAREFYPQVLEGVTGEVMAAIYEGALSDSGVSLRRCDSIAEVLHREGDSRGFEVRDETVGRLVFFIFAEGKPERPELAMRRVYALAKSFCPELLGGMSLHDLGKVFGEGDEKGNRARWSARVKTLVIKTVEESGAVAHMKFQKSASTCRKYSAAQRGNQNRKKK
jgi:hypothetical protein